MKGIMRFGKKGKLSLRYLGPNEITQQVGKVTYKLELLGDMSAIHMYFMFRY